MTLAQRCQMISALILDVDGVLTAGGIVYTDAGSEIKSFHVRDGSAIKLWQRAGKQIGILSGRKSAVTALRARELGIQHVEQGNPDKVPGFQIMLQHLQCDAAQVAYMGDDLADVPLMQQSALAIAPADACIEAVQSAHLVVRKPGGKGAVSEAIQWILHSQGLWPMAPA